ncbi:MAG: maleylpyruvate isomerase N-terminal domain-containing protein, partial [Actinomycetota bacterium]
MSNPARTERDLICDLFTNFGPDAPTLCAGWTTRDLAAHIAVRERRPDAAAGILIER